MLQSTAATTPSVIAIAMFDRRLVTSPIAQMSGMVVLLVASVTMNPCSSTAHPSSTASWLFGIGNPATNSAPIGTVVPSINSSDETVLPSPLTRAIARSSTFTPWVTRSARTTSSRLSWNAVTCWLQPVRIRAMCGTNKIEPVTARCESSCSKPSQYGQVNTPRPQCSARPAIGGGLPLAPVAMTQLSAAPPQRIGVRPPTRSSTNSTVGYLHDSHSDAAMMSPGAAPSSVMDPCTCDTATVLSAAERF